MGFIRKIAPVLLLSIFSLTQLHAILPHVHHEHHLDSESEHHHKDDHENSIDDSHNHDNVSEFIAHFFDIHSHQEALHEILIIVDNTKVKSQIKSTQGDFSYKIAVPEKERKPIVTRFSNIYYPISYLSSFSLRGPPSLV